MIFARMDPLIQRRGVATATGPDEQRVSYPDRNFDDNDNGRSNNRDGEKNLDQNLRITSLSRVNMIKHTKKKTKRRCKFFSSSPFSIRQIHLVLGAILAFLIYTALADSRPPRLHLPRQQQQSISNNNSNSPYSTYLRENLFRKRTSKNFDRRKNEERNRRVENPETNEIVDGDDEKNEKKAKKKQSGGAKLSINKPGSPYTLISDHFSELIASEESRKNSFSESYYSGEMKPKQLLAMGSLQPDEVWMTTGDILVLKGGSMPKDRGPRSYYQNSQEVIPLDDYEAPYREPVLPPPNFIPKEDGVGVPLPPEDEDESSEDYNEITDFFENRKMAKLYRNYLNDIRENKQRKLIGKVDEGQSLGLPSDSEEVATENFVKTKTMIAQKIHKQFESSTQTPKIPVSVTKSPENVEVRSLKRKTDFSNIKIPKIGGHLVKPVTLKAKTVSLPPIEETYRKLRNNPYRQRGASLGGGKKRKDIRHGKNEGPSIRHGTARHKPTKRPSLAFLPEPAVPYDDGLRSRIVNTPQTSKLDENRNIVSAKCSEYALKFGDSRMYEDSLKICDDIRERNEIDHLGFQNAQKYVTTERINHVSNDKNHVDFSYSNPSNNVFYDYVSNDVNHVVTTANPIYGYNSQTEKALNAHVGFSNDHVFNANHVADTNALNAPVGFSNDHTKSNNQNHVFNHVGFSNNDHVFNNENHVGFTSENLNFGPDFFGIEEYTNRRKRLLANLPKPDEIRSLQQRKSQQQQQTAVYPQFQTTAAPSYQAAPKQLHSPPAAATSTAASSSSSPWSSPWTRSFYGNNDFFFSGGGGVNGQFQRQNQPTPSPVSVSVSTVRSAVKAARNQPAANRLAHNNHNSQQAAKNRLAQGGQKKDKNYAISYVSNNQNLYYWGYNY